MSALLDIRDPSTGTLIDRVANLDAPAVVELVDRARAAQIDWSARAPRDRAHVLDACRRWLVRNREQVAAVTLRETGATREEALLYEVFLTADALAHWARRGPALLADERVRSRSPFVAGRRLSVCRRPVGVVGIVAPWNFPLALGVGDAIPAVMAGNSVVLKPSEYTPLASILVADAFRAAGLPEGVLTVATGGPATGAALVNEADFVAFTGSTTTGRRIAARCGERLIGCSLELGGKDPMIVLADADLDRAANAAVTFRHGALRPGVHERRARVRRAARPRRLRRTAGTPRRRSATRSA